MELDLNLGQPDNPPPVPGASLRAPVSPHPIPAELGGEIAAGCLILQVGEPGGIVLREAARAERAHFRPRPAPIMLRPRSLRSLVDRRMETAAVLSALDAGLPVEVSGAPGVGKTALLRHVAHHPRTRSFVDGIVYLSARHQTCLDLLQRIFAGNLQLELQVDVRSCKDDVNARTLGLGQRFPCPSDIFFAGAGQGGNYRPTDFPSNGAYG